MVLDVIARWLVMFRRFAFLSAVCLALSACITSENPIPLDAVTSFKLTDVSVDFPLEARLNYTGVEDEYAAKMGADSHDYARAEALIQSPEGVAYIRSRAAEKMRTAFNQSVGPILNGTHPVRIEVAVIRIDVPGAARSIFLGGNASLVARVSLVDAENGHVISTLPNQFEMARRGGAILGTAVQSIMETSKMVDEPYQRLCEALAQDYAEWLFKKRASSSS